MEGEQSWLNKLQNAVIQKGEVLEKQDIPKLREFLGIYQTYFENIFNILIKKSLIQEDPYKYDEKISEVSAPPTTDFLESEKQDHMSQRLSSYHSQLDFLNTYYQFSLDFLNLSRIKRIVSLVKYISWDHLTGGKSNMVSRILDDYLGKVRLGSDSLSAQIVQDSISQLDRITNEVMRIFKEMTLYQREAYKLEVRNSVLSQLEPGTLNLANGSKTIKQNFQKYINDRPFYPELIQEIINEDFSSQSNELKEDLIKKLAVKTTQKKKKKKEVSYKELLLQAVRYMASSGFQLEDVVSKMTDNHVAYASRKVGLGRRISQFFRKLAGGGDENQIYEIEYFDVASSSMKTETIIYGTFIEDLKKKAKLFAALVSRNSQASHKLLAASEERIYKFLNRNLSSLQTLHRRLMGFNDFFKAEMPADRRNKYRGLKVELSAIKNSLIKANQSKHEYVAVMEEQAQMKRLGISMDDD